MAAVTIQKVVQETVDAWTLLFKGITDAKPGQYLMVWIPGVDEIPMSLSTIGDPSSITVRVVGDATRALSKLRVGDRIGIRGPFGNSYKPLGKRPLIIGGGSGIASLTPLTEALVAKGAKPTFILGARSMDQILFKSRLFRLLGECLAISTDDGTEGYHGFASDYAVEFMDRDKFDYVYICGPEIMAVKVWAEAEKRGIPVQVSLERLCKCAVGLCGSCGIGPYRVCRDGPIFDSTMLREVSADFGKRRMDETGRMIGVGH